MGNSIPLSILSEIKVGKMAPRFWLLRGFILYLRRWGFAVPFYFVQDCRPASVKRI